MEVLEQRLALAADAWPTVTSINTVPFDGPYRDTVSWSVAFSEPVTGVDAADFQVAKTGTAAFPSSGALAVTGNGTAYTVRLTGVSGVGTVGLNLVDNSSIRDATGNPLTKAGAAATFAAQKTTPIGGWPFWSHGIVVGDLNGDGKQDFVTSNQQSGTLSVRLGTGDGTFTVANGIAASGARGMTVGDVNGDGRLDLIFLNRAANSVGVVLGNGDGSFQAEQSFAVGSTPLDVTVADFNRDGKPDLAVANCDGRSISLLQGKGDGSFQEAVSYGLSANPRWIRSADLNADAKPDLVVMNADATSMVLLGDGAGVFSTPAVVGRYGGAVEVADFNGDDVVDLVAADYSGGTVRALLGRGDGTFSPQSSYSSGSSSTAVVVRDFNGDGWPDVAVTNETSSSVSLLLGRGDGTFQPKQTLSVGSLPGSLAVADFNGDGRPDLAVANQSYTSSTSWFGSTSYFSTVSILLNNNSSGNFTGQTASVSVAAPSAPTGINAVAGNKQATVSWTAPADENGGAITKYTVQYTIVGGTSWTTVVSATTATQATISNLAAGSSYVFKVAANNAAGTGAYSDVSTAVVPFASAAAPTALTALPDAIGQVKLSWTPPAAPAGGAITDYSIQYSSNNGTEWKNYPHDPLITSPVVISGLTLGTSYVFRVAAVNVGGAGVYAKSAAVVPRTMPTAPASVSATGGDSKAIVTWTAPLSNGGSAITGYKVEYAVSSGTDWKSITAAATATTATVTGLINGTSYLFRVSAVNVAGTGAAALVSDPITVMKPALAPTTLVGKPGSTSVDLTWVIPNDGGSPIKDYVIQYSTNGGAAWTSFSHSPSAFVQPGSATAAAATVTGLANGTSYVFQVAAITDAGQGAFAKSTAVVPRTVPTAPASVSVTGGDSKATVTWTAPLSNGGSAITGYKVEYAVSSGTDWKSITAAATATTATVTGLINGTSYLFRVSAVNVAGTGEVAVSGPITVMKPALAPTALVGKSGPTKVDLTWVIPNDGGSAIKDYEIQYSTNNGTVWTPFPHSLSAFVQPGSTTLAAATVTGLTNGTSYVFQVAAITDAGRGAFAKSAAVVPTDVPGVPGGLLSGAGNARASVSWTAPVTNGSAISKYVVQLNEDIYAVNADANWRTVSSPTTTLATVTGLANGKYYWFRVAAVNAVGQGAFTTASVAVMPDTPPAAATGLKTAPGNGSMGLSWSTPVLNGTPTTSYLVQYARTGSTVWTTFGRTTTATPAATVTGLINGVGYSFRVAATNAAGTGVFTAAVAGTPVATPFPAVTGITVKGTSSVGATTVSWDVKFSRSVNGVDASDFAVVKVASQMSGSLTVTGSGAAYVVTATGVSGLGTLGLNLVDDGSIRDAVNGNPLQASPAGLAFQQTSTGVGTGPVALVAADLNLDGKPDAVVVNQLSKTVSVLLNAGGALASQQEYDIGRGGSAVTVADVNSDGWPDLVVANSDDNSVGILINKGFGSFRTQATVALTTDTGPLYGPSAVAVGDINSDGNADIVVADFLSDKVSLLLGSGYGQFPTQAHVSVGSRPQSVSLVDLNSDGKLDILVANSASNTVGVLLGNGNGTFQAQVTVDAGSSPKTLVAADVNNDGKLDLAVLNSDLSQIASGQNAVSLLLGKGDGTFQTRQSIVVGGWPQSLAVADINSDGKPDLAIVDGDKGTAGLLLGKGDGTFQPLQSYAVGSFAAAFAVADINADSRPDLVVADLTTGKASVLAAQPGGSFTGQLAALSNRPVAPTGLVGTPGNAQVALSWVASASNGGTAVSDYVVEYRLASATTWQTWSHDTSTATTATVTGLTNGASYVFRVAAVNLIGAGVASSASAAVVPFTVAAAPTSLVATAGFRQATLSWAAPASDGGRAITDYKVEYRPTSAANWQAFTRAISTATTATVTGLTNGTGYVFRVSAVTAAGQGGLSDVSAEVVPAVQLPGFPQSLSGRSGDSAVVLTWSAPAFDGGGAISDYTVQYSTDGSSWQTFSRAASAAATATVTGLTAGTSYQFRVAAVNSAGQGSFTAASAAVLVTTVPGVPKNPVGVPGCREVALSWSAPDTNGFSAITDYTVEYRPTAASDWQTFTHASSTATTATVTGLTIGTSYVFRVSAVNGSGAGAASAVSAEVVPITTAPGVPRNLVGTTSDRQVNLSWLAPLSDGGSAISSYEVQYSSNGGSTWSTFGRTAATVVAVTGLTNDTPYVFRVAAINALGTGVATAASAAVTPAVAAFPYVTGISLTAPVAPGASSVSWNVTFNVPVTGVDATDFQLVNQMAVSGRLAPMPTLAVAGSGTSYTVTASGLTGTGTLGLNLVDNGTIRDAGARPLLNRGPASFENPWSAVPLYPAFDSKYTCDPQVVADFNGDGQADFAGTTQYSSDSLSMFLGNGDGTFRPVLTTVGWYSKIVGVGDLNNDGRVDLVLGWSDFFTPLFGVGDGSFQMQQGLDYKAVAVADFTHDGRPDVLALNPTNNTLGVLVNTGSGSFQPQQAFVKSGSISDAAVTDIDRDGWPDVVVTHGDDDTLGLLLNDQAGGFKAEQTYAAGDTPGSVRAADVNNDGWADVVVVNAASRTLGIMLGSSGGLQPQVETAVAPESPSSLAITDINGDGLPDLLVGTSQGFENDILAGNGDGTFRRLQSWRTWTPFPVADFNNDGRPDIVGSYQVVNYGDRYYEGIQFNAGRGDYTGEVALLRSAAAKPEGLATVAGNAQVGLSWSAPAATGGSAITDYTIQFSTNGGATWSTISHTPSTATTYTAAGLENGAAYRFRVAAVTAAGVGAFTNPTASVTPVTTPDIVYGKLRVLSVGSGRADIAWSGPLSDGGSPITGYVIRYSVDNGVSWTNFNRENSNSSQARVTGLTDGSTYLFQVAAQNDVGIGPYAGSNPVALKAPAAPTSISASTPGSYSSEVWLGWTAPAAETGSVIDRYEAQYSSDATTWLAVPPNATAQSWQGFMSISTSDFLRWGNYKFRIAGVNGFGVGAYATSDWVRI